METRKGWIGMAKKRKLIILLALAILLASQVACETGPSWGGLSFLAGGVVSLPQ